jgi:hypothetical protein
LVYSEQPLINCKLRAGTMAEGSNADSFRSLSRVLWKAQQWYRHLQKIDSNLMQHGKQHAVGVTFR